MAAFFCSCPLSFLHQPEVTVVFSKRKSGHFTLLPWLHITVGRKSLLWPTRFHVISYQICVYMRITWEHWNYYYVGITTNQLKSNLWFGTWISAKFQNFSGVTEAQWRLRAFAGYSSNPTAYHFPLLLNLTHHIDLLLAPDTCLRCSWLRIFALITFFTTSTSMAYSLPPFRPLLKCHLFRGAFPDHLI